MKKLGRIIKLLRRQKLLDQSYMAEKLKLSVPSYSKIENGKFDLRMSRLEQIAKIFDVTIVELLTFNEDGNVQNYLSRLDLCEKKRLQQNEDIILLQQKVIDLQDKLANLKTK